MFLRCLLLVQHCSLYIIYNILFNSQSCEVDAIILKEKDKQQARANAGDKLNAILLRDTHQDAIWRSGFLGLVIWPVPLTFGSS